VCGVSNQGMATGQQGGPLTRQDKMAIEFKAVGSRLNDKAFDPGKSNGPNH